MKVTKKMLLFIIFISCFLFLDKIKADDCPNMVGGSGTVYKFNTMGGNNIDDIHVCNTCADAQHIDEIELPTPEKKIISLMDGIMMKIIVK